ncbi:hypothetical protein LR48_Vigan06g074800 [Vigna angularis]|uniref:Uncharacterized protein n=1 Tax=Phaseolus angularis TaxID=3914 RepID=A0A0L9USA6_PHAAN|nr:hypothetical protein LR48_Vigan06g074800 [Vigna angularis]
MLEEQPVLFRRSPSRRRLRPRFDTDDRGWTSLHVLARKGDLKLADVHAGISEGITVVKLPQSSASKFDPNYLFLQKGAFISKLPKLYLNILPRVVDALRVEFVSYLSQKVKKLLDEGMNVNVSAWGPKSKGVTPLHLAAEGGHIGVMDVLLEHGADIDARTKGACGWTPLHIAAKERRRDAVKFLIENGAFLPPDINDCRFNPPLHYCPGLEWAYEEMKRHRLLDLSSGETSYSSES